ncbi:TolC family protein [Myroides albus]|uniref:TolC family protein n=1 Tax=Myroides albus TaxID=2562892 RepID=UPI002158C57F|nr:TolC family protein [Myroides albus]UVD81261.1 TolC family protein [Myroides albus]
MSKNWCLVLTILFSVVGVAQEKWTLEYCVEKGKENSLKLMVAALETQVVERQKQSVVSYYLPNIGVNGNQGYNFGSAIDPTTNSRVSSNIASTQLSLDANVELFNWSNIVKYQQESLALNMSELSEQEVLFHYQSSLLLRFYEIVGLQEYLKIQVEQLKNSETNYKRVLKEVDAGAKPNSDLYDIEYIYNSEQIAIERTQNNLYNQKLQFLHFLNMSDSQVELFELVNNTESIGLFTDYLFNPRLEKQRLNSLFLQKEKQLISSQSLPKLSVSYQYGSFYSKPFNTALDAQVNAFSKQLGDNKSHYVGIRLSIPVFTGGVVIRQVRTKNTEIALNDLKIKEIELELNNENTQLEHEIQQLKTLEKNLIKSIEMSEKSFTTTQVKYENGKVDIFSFNSAKNQLLTSQYALVKNNLDRQFLEKRLALNNSNKL